MIHHPEGAPTRAELPAWLEELERLDQAGMHGPWRAERYWNGEWMCVYPDGEDVSVLDERHAKLIAAMRNALPELLSLARKHYEAESSRLPGVKP